MSPKKRYCYEYPRPAVTVDVVIVTRERRPRVLLIRRKHEPFAGLWAIPGGFVDMDEALEAAAARELREETGVAAQRLEQLRTFRDPGRPPPANYGVRRGFFTLTPSPVHPRRANHVRSTNHPLLGSRAGPAGPGPVRDPGRPGVPARRRLPPRPLSLGPRPRAVLQPPPA